MNIVDTPTNHSFRVACRCASKSIVFALLACVAWGLPLQVPAEDEEIAIEEIVVTARYREESVQDIGASIKAIGSDELNERGVNTISELMALTPSLYNQERGPNRNEISIRGIGRSLFQQDLSIANPTIGMYFDDVPLNVVVGSQLDIRNLDLDRVEVVRGPQGTLFGEGAEGGAVRFFSRNPDLDELGANITLIANSIENGGAKLGGKATVNLPISDGLAGVRLSAGRFAVDGFIDNTFDGVNNNNGYVADVFRGVFLADPDNGWRFRLSAHYEEFDQDSFTSSNPQDPDSREYCCAGTSDNFVAEDSLILSGNISYAFDKFSVESITSYYERNRERRIFDHFFTNNELVSVFFLDLLGLSGLIYGGPFPLGDPAVHSLGDWEWEQFSQEIRFVSNLDGPFNFVAGAFYRDFEFLQIDSTESDLYPTLLPLFLGNLVAMGIPFGAPPANPSTNLSVLAGQLGLIGIPQLNDAPEFRTVTNDGEQYSLFGEATFAVNEQLRLIGGLRWHNEEIDLYSIEGAWAVLSALQPAIPAPFGSQADIDNLLPKVSVEWNPNDSTLVYFTFSEGLRNGNVNGFLGSFANLTGRPPAEIQEVASYGPEFAQSFELGLKGTWMDDRLTLNAALWHTDIEDVQGTAQIVDTSTGTAAGATQNIGDGHTRGVELEFLVRTGEYVSLFGGFNYTEAEMDDIFSSDVLDISVVEGQRIPFIPDYTVNIGALLNIPINGGWEVFGHLDYQYVGDFTTFILGVEGARANPELGDYGVVNLGLGIRNDQWSLDVRVTNLLDEAELIQASPTTEFIENAIGGFNFLPVGTPVDNFDDYQINRPRTIWMTVGYSF